MMTETITDPSFYQTVRQRTQQQRHHFQDDADVAGGIVVVGHEQQQQQQHSSPPRVNTSTAASTTEGMKSEMDPLLKTPPSMNLHETSDDKYRAGLIYATILPANNNNNKTSSSLSPSSSTISSSYSTTKRSVLVFGCDISHLSRKYQFIISASGVFFFSLLYGYLQELISVTLCSRQLGLFLAMVQFIGYALWSRFFNSHVQRKHGPALLVQRQQQQLQQTQYSYDAKNEEMGQDDDNIKANITRDVPIKYYILLSILRAIDASMTNMAMAYLNYPAKTLMKSSRVVFTMLFGTIVSRKRYKLMDYLVVFLMVSGLAIFMHADSQSSAVFQPLGIVMLTTSLCCDAVINNMSERIMNQYHIGQDEYIYKLYSIALVGIVGAAALRGDLVEGTRYLLTPGTYQEILNGEEPSWSIHGKTIAFFLFSSTGFLGSSCSAFITKEFGALVMSITSTARKATTLFLSFALFNNVCTVEHLSGIFLFISALVGKSIRASQKGHGGGADGSSIQLQSQLYNNNKQSSVDPSVSFATDTDTMHASSSSSSSSPIMMTVDGYYGRNNTSIKRRVSGGTVLGGRRHNNKNYGEIV